MFEVERVKAMKHITGYLSLLSFMSLVSLPAQAAHIMETMTLEKGWNAIYLESTPVNAACEDFFAGAPAKKSSHTALVGVDSR